MEAHKSKLVCYPFRLTAGQELKSSLMQFAKQHKLTAAFVLTCCGGLQKATIRFARKDGGEEIKTFNEHLEILSLVGTLTGDKGHLHISVGDKNGNVHGGHAMGDLIIYTTAECVVAECDEVDFERHHDHSTGFPELVVKKK